MTTAELVFTSLSDLAQRLKTGDLSPVELVLAYLKKIDLNNAKLKAYISVVGDVAVKKAKQAETDIRNGNYRGPLHGIPYSCKDMFLTRNITTTGGSRVLEDWLPEYDAAVVERIAHAGGILLGKTNLHEFAYGATGENPHYGTAVNPADITRLAGGSSSGSAAAMAGGLCTFALGTDTGGSTRAPAALCGVVGLKPTYGRVSTHGTIPYCWSLDHVGIFSRTVEDAAFVLEVLAGYDPRDSHSTDISVPPFSQRLREDLKGYRFGIPRQFFFERVDSDIEAGVLRAIRLCEENGAIVTEVDVPPMEKTRTVSLVIQLPEMLSYHSRYLLKKKHLYGPDLLGGMALGQCLLAEHYVRAKRMVEWYRRQMTQTFQEIDILLTPSCPITAPKAGEAFVNDGEEQEAVGNAITRYTSFFNMTGNPAITIPCGINPKGLPIGVQLVAHHFREDVLLSASHALERRMQEN